MKDERLKIRDKGFTIIELLVVMGIFATVAGIATSIFVTVLRAQNKAMVVSQVKDEGDRALETMLREVRAAESVIIHDSENLDNLDGDTQADDSYIEVTKFGATTIFSCVHTSDNGTPGNDYLARGLPPSDTPLMNTDPKKGVDLVTSCANVFSQVSLGPPQVIRIYFYLSQGISAPTRQDYQVTIPFVSTVSQRNY